MDLKRWSERTIIALLGALLISTGVMLIYYLYIVPNLYFPSADLLRRIEVLVASLALLANFGLTAGLLYIYINQNRVLRDEMAVLEGQQELMRIGQQPEIDGPYDVRMFGTDLSGVQSREIDGLTDLRWISDHLRVTGTVETSQDSVSIDIGSKNEPATVGPPEDGLRFHLSNSGGGFARKFQLWSWLLIHEGPHEGMWARSPVKRLDRYSLHEYADNILQPGDQDVEFQGEVQLKIREPPDEDDEIGEFSTHSFSEGVEKLVREGTEEIQVVLELRYEDTFEEEYSNQFYSHRADISTGMDWGDFIKKESPTRRYINESEQERSWSEQLRVMWYTLRSRYRQWNPRSD